MDITHTHIYIIYIHIMQCLGLFTFYWQLVLANYDEWTLWWISYFLLPGSLRLPNLGPSPQPRTLTSTQRSRYLRNLSWKVLFAAMHGAWNWNEPCSSWKILPGKSFRSQELLMASWICRRDFFFIFCSWNWSDGFGDVEKINVKVDLINYIPEV